MISRIGVYHYFSPESGNPAPPKDPRRYLIHVHTWKTHRLPEIIIEHLPELAYADWVMELNDS